MAHREHRKLHAPAREEGIAGDEQGIGPLAPKRREGRLDLAAGAGVEHLNLQSEGACGFRYISQRGLGDGWSVGRIDQHGDPNGLGHHLTQEPQPLGR